MDDVISTRGVCPLVMAGLADIDHTEFSSSDFQHATRTAIASGSIDIEENRCQTVI